MKKGESKWLEVYFQLTAKGRSEQTLKKRLVRGSILGRFSFGENAVLSYFRRFKTQPRSLAQIWAGLAPGCTKKELLSALTKLRGKGYIKKA